MYVKIEWSGSNVSTVSTRASSNTWQSLCVGYACRVHDDDDDDDDDDSDCVDGRVCMSR